MPIKKVANNLTVTRMALGEMRSFVTRSKKSHFTVSEAKLCRHLTIALNTTGGFFVPYISFVPNVAVHVYGREDKLVEHADWLESQILKALTDYHDKGLDKIKAPKY